MLIQKKKQAIIDFCNWSNQNLDDFKLLPLTKNLSAIVDNILYPYLKQFNWRVISSSKKGYLICRDIKKGGIYLLNREVWTRYNGLIPKNMCVGYINQDTLDNRIENLELVSRRVYVLSKKNINPTGYKGVFQNYGSKFYYASIKHKYLGVYHTALYAAKAYDNAARSLNYPESVLNFPNDPNSFVPIKIKKYKEKSFNLCNTLNKQNISFKFIPLNNEKFAIIDANLYDYVSSFNWSVFENRVVTSIKNKSVGMARFIWEKVKGSIPSSQKIIHKNKNPLDNRLFNLQVGGKTIKMV